MHEMDRQDFSYIAQDGDDIGILPVFLQVLLQRTPDSYLHGTQFFYECINRRDGRIKNNSTDAVIAEVSDNDWETSHRRLPIRLI